MFRGFTIKIRQFFLKADFGPKRHLFQALLISLIAHCLVVLVLGPSLGISMSPSVGQLAGSLNVLVLGSANMDERGALGFARSTSVPVDPGESGGGRRLVQSVPDPGGANGPAVSVRAQQKTDAVLNEPSQIVSNSDKAIIQPDRTYGFGFGFGLSRPPQLVSDVSIVYPEAAGDKQGMVQLRISVNESGRINDMTVLKAEPEGLFEEAALSAFAGAEFNPGQFLGQPVVSDYIVEIDFLPISRDGTSGRGY